MPVPAWKRGSDLAYGVLLLPALALCTFVIAAVMWARSPGPVLFRQERLGFHGRRFRAYKFRTTAAAVFDPHSAATPGSPRPASPGKLIPLGWWLRAAGLDDLPQVLNVLRGEMSIVGPRPCHPAEFGDQASLPAARFQTAPGLTGAWRFCSRQLAAESPIAVALDRAYLQRRSFWLDLQIILRTPLAAIAQVFAAHRHSV